VWRGSAPIQAREKAMLFACLMVAMGVLSVYLRGMVWVMVVICMGAFALQFWGANLDTFPTDLLPPEHVARVTGFAGSMGALGGILFTASTGYMVSHYSYTPVWIASGMTYPLGLLLLFLLLRPFHASQI
jgi:MFS transporter, ACS family, aldohexuronate transporter